MSDFKHTCKYEQIDEYTFKCSICDKEKMPKELVKDLEHQISTSKQSNSDLEDMLVALKEEHQEEVKALERQLAEASEKNESFVYVVLCWFYDGDSNLVDSFHAVKSTLEEAKATLGSNDEILKDEDLVYEDESIYPKEWGSYGSQVKYEIRKVRL